MFSNKDSANREQDAQAYLRHYAEMQPIHARWEQNIHACLWRYAKIQPILCKDSAR